MFRNMGTKDNAKDELLKQLEEASIDPPASEKEDLSSSSSDHGSTRASLGSKSDDAEDEEFLKELEPSEVLKRDDSLLVQEFLAAEDLNKAGLQRAKKDAIQQEVHCSAFGFMLNY